VGQWLLLIALSTGLSLLLERIGMPASRMFGPLLAGALFTSCGARLRLTPNLFLVSQGLIGCMIAKMLPSWFYTTVTANWPVYAIGVLSVIVVSTGLGWWLTRLGVLPGSTALWGLSPGASTAMILMADAYGGDAELVAFMQYLRVVIVALIAAAVGRIWGAAPGHAHIAIELFPAFSWISLGETLALAVIGPVLAQRLQIRAGAFLIPLFAGVFLAHRDLLHIELPPWLLMLAYAIVGWRIGFRFTLPLLRNVARAIPRLLGCTLALVLICGVMSLGLVLATGVDPLSAYLAMSPGGADTVAIIAASSHVDIPFVMAMQMLRLIAVLLIAPRVAKVLTAHALNAKDVLPR